MASERPPILRGIGRLTAARFVLRAGTWPSLAVVVVVSLPPAGDAAGTLADTLDWMLHSGGYAGLGLLTALAYPAVPHVRSAGGLMLFGLVLELLQEAFVPGRSAELHDVVANCTGVVLGMLAGAILEPTLRQLARPVAMR